MDWIPLEDTLLIEVDEVKSAVELMEETKDRLRGNTGTVVALGPLYQSGAVSVGNQVVFMRFAGTELEMDGKHYRVIKPSELLLVKRVVAEPPCTHNVRTYGHRLAISVDAINQAAPSTYGDHGHECD